MFTVHAYSPECDSVTEPSTTLLMYLDRDFIIKSSLVMGFSPLGPVQSTCISTVVFTATIHSTVQLRSMEEPERIGFGKLEINLTTGETVYIQELFTLNCHSTVTDYAQYKPLRV